MTQEIKGSQVADRGSTISNSKNETNISIKRIRAESAIISLIVGIVSSVVASYVYDHFFR